MHGSTLILNAFWIDNKPFPTAQSANSNLGRVFYDFYEGPAWHVGWMDLVLLKSLIKKHNVNHIILQDLGTLGAIAQVTREVKVCVAYEHKSFIINSLSPDKDLIHCKPIYETIEFGGWEFSDDAYTVPSRAQRYIRYLLIKTRVNYITCMNNKIKFTAHFDILGNVVFETEPNL